MAVTSTAQGRIFCSADPVVLHGNPRPMVHGIGQALMAGLSSDHDQALAGPLGNWRDSGQTAQGGVITSLQGIEAFCKQRGENDPSHSRQGCEDLHVMLLFLSRLGLSVQGNSGCQRVKAFVSLFDLCIEQPDARYQRCDVRSCRFRCSSRDAYRLLSQDSKHMGSVEAANTITLQKLGSCRFTHAARLGWRRYGFPKV